MLRLIACVENLEKILGFWVVSTGVKKLQIPTHLFTHITLEVLQHIFDDMKPISGLGNIRQINKSCFNQGTGITNEYLGFMLRK